MLTFLALAGIAQAADQTHTMSWMLSVEGKQVGTRELTVRYLEGDAGTNRILESYTDINGALGPVQVRYRQRLTAHIDAREPAAFHSVVDDNGTMLEVQGRWTPSNWVVTTTTAGRSRTTDMPLPRIDLSTADLMDPYTRVPLSHLEQARILSAETGEVLVGPVENLGVSQLTFGGTVVQVSGYAWTSPQGRSEFYYSPDGFLVKYRTQLLGSQIEASLTEAPPGGVDDFPVGSKGPSVEEIEVN